MDSDFVIQFGCLVRYKGCSSEVVIPEGITTIGEKAFIKNGTIEKVIIPNGVETIESNAFTDCPLLNDIILPETIKEIRTYAFGRLDQKKELELYIHSRLSIGVFKNKCDQLTAISVLSKRFSEFDKDSDVYKNNLIFIGKHLKLEEKYFGSSYGYLMENGDLRNAVFEAKAISVKDADWLLGVAQEKGRSDVVSELLEYKNKFLSDKKTRKKYEKSEERKAEKALSLNIPVSEWRERFKFTYENGGAVITGTKIREEIIEIPQKIGSKNVVALDWKALAFNVSPGEDLWFPKKIIIPAGISEIRKGAFYVLEEAEIFIPDTVSELPEGCFVAVKKLVLHIPASVIKISDEFIWDCDKKEAIGTIYAPAGSFAETYAKENNIPFVAE
ncbi:MAG: leucine-rich repeat protein [Oscillospiraceae bacterium]|nr:leucine-rich repeat protein [Oscillospiraceae bacterium]